MRIWLTLLALNLTTVLRSALALSKSVARNGRSLLQVGTRINQTIEEVVATDYLFFNSLLEVAELDEPFKNVTIFVPLSDRNGEVSRYMSDPKWILHARDIVDTMVYNDPISFLGLFLTNNLSMRNGEEIQIASTTGNGTANIALASSTLPGSQPSQIVVPDIEALNGVTIHLIEYPLLPSWSRVDFTRLLTHPLTLTNFSITFEMYMLSGLWLVDSPVYTMLLPSNSAYLGHEDLLEYVRNPDNREEQRILASGHVFPELYPHIKAQDGDILTSEAGTEVAVTVNENNTVFFNNAMLLSEPWFLSGLGLVYGIDQILLPTSPWTTPVTPTISPSSVSTTNNQSYVRSSVPTVSPSSVPTAQNQSYVRSPVPVAEKDRLSGGPIVGIVLVPFAAILALGGFLTMKYSDKEPSHAVPVAAALSTEPEGYRQPPLTTVEPAVVEILPAITPFSERTVRNARVSPLEQSDSRPDQVVNATKSIGAAEPPFDDNAKEPFSPDHKDQLRDVMEEAPKSRELADVTEFGPAFKDQARNVSRDCENQQKEQGEIGYYKYEI